MTKAVSEVLREVTAPQEIARDFVYGTSVGTRMRSIESQRLSLMD